MVTVEFPSRKPLSPLASTSASKQQLKTSNDTSTRHFHFFDARVRQANRVLTRSGAEQSNASPHDLLGGRGGDGVEGDGVGGGGVVFVAALDSCFDLTNNN